jgi:soluble lytic murein transglycosylase-like protein
MPPRSVIRLASLARTLVLPTAWLIGMGAAQAEVQVAAGTPVPARQAQSILAAQASDETQQIAQWRAEAAAYEHGEGVPRDPARAAALYCQAARLGDALSQFDLGWMHANGRGVPRDESVASYFFAAAAAQGDERAARLQQQMGPTPESEPACMRPPEPPAPERAATVAAAPEAPKLPPLRALPPQAPKPIVDLVRKLAPQFQLEPYLVLAIMATESNFDALAVSAKNAQGLMQLIPDTAARFNVRDPFDPAQNIRGGMAYLRWLLAHFEGDVSLVAAAYNAGEGTVERYKGIPPFAETRAYVERIRRFIGDLSLPFDASVTRPAAHLRSARVLLSRN